ncbi:MAG: hypothetical protein K9H25_21115 [Rhodospirillum sp.]|nr:hypothetical protein [Rhodospirillum sp.]MCF8500942.1 hypothetical protein [Rhodospirillum sp.]
MSPNRRAEQAQLPLPFQPSVMSGLTQEEKVLVRKALARLLLLAVGQSEEEIADDQ